MFTLASLSQIGLAVTAILNGLLTILTCILLGYVAYNVYLLLK